MYNPLLLIDFYKATHHEQYPKGLTKMVSYYTPRMSRLKDVDKVTFFGLQAFIKEYLIKGFNENFFNRPEEEVVAEYERVLNATLGKGSYESQKIRDLHRLGYLPLQIRAVPEGTRTAIGVPQIEISNTHPDFVWLVNTIETMLSCSMWHTQISSEVGYRYYQIVKKFWEKTCDPDVNPRRLLGDFSMRGQQSVESAIKSSAGWCLSFLNTATVPAILWLEDNYNCDCTKDEVAYGAISTEHSVMCSNFAVDGDEITHIRRLLTEIYPHHSFSMVSDSYNYWNLVDNILPQLKDEILAHDGCISIRGDSGDPVQVVTDTVFHLWNMFGGTINSKGYKVLNPHVRAIYGDSITPIRCKAIYEILEKNGFAINNVALGVGSFSMMCIQTEETVTCGNCCTAVPYTQLGGYTRDTFGIAVKATYAEDAVGNPIMIYKQPKALSWKKSQKGCCIVSIDGQGYTDSHIWKETIMAEHDNKNLLTSVFCNGQMDKEYTLAEVRNNLYKEGF